MKNTIANAVVHVNSKCEFTYQHQPMKIGYMKESEENEIRRKILEDLVNEAGGKAAFCRKYSRDDAEKPISATFISQLINKHRTFGEKAARNLENQAGFDKYFFDRFDKKDHPSKFVSKRKKEIAKLNVLQEELDDLDFVRVQAFCEALKASKTPKKSNDDQ